MLIEVKELGFRFGRGPFLWRGIELGLAAGEVLAVLGPNGTGKTTFIKSLVGLLPPTEGRVHCTGSIGYVPQSTQLAFSYLVRDVVAMGRARYLGLLGTLQPHDYGAIRAAIEQCGLANFAEREFMQLSGGERQLVLIARALASESEIIVLDEPMASLDLLNQSRILDLFARLAGERNAAVIFSTHHPEHAFRVASRALLLGGDRPPTIVRIVEIETEERITRHAVPIL